MLTDIQYFYNMSMNTETLIPYMSFLLLFFNNTGLIVFL